MELPRDSEGSRMRRRKKRGLGKTIGLCCFVVLPVAVSVLIGLIGVKYMKSAKTYPGVFGNTLVSRDFLSYVLSFIAPPLIRFYEKSQGHGESRTVYLDGLDAPVEIKRDAHGVGYIYAETERDMYAALGYYHAQERMWQIELTRRLAAGRVSEVLGDAAIPLDRFSRTMGFVEKAKEDEKELEYLATVCKIVDHELRMMAAFASGFNNYLINQGPKQVEFQILNFTPEPYTVLDQLVLLRFMSFQMNRGWSHEIAQTLLQREFGKLKAELDVHIDLRIPFINEESAEPSLRTTDGGPMQFGSMLAKDQSKFKYNETPHSHHNWFRMDPADFFRRHNFSAHNHSAPKRMPKQNPDVHLPSYSGGGSNAWAVSGDHTTTGKPLLAGDPHLGLTFPGFWLYVFMSAGKTEPLGSRDGKPFRSIGGAVPGVPVTLIGHSDYLALSVCLTYNDVEDLYREKLVNETHYTVDGKHYPLLARHHVIKVKDKPDSVHIARSSHRGPLLSDVLPGAAAIAPQGTAISLASLSLRAPASLGSVDFLIRYTNMEEYELLANSLDFVSLALTFADVHGNIGVYFSGQIPLRPGGGRAMSDVRDGSTSKFDWTGALSTLRQPSVLNPPTGYVVAANQQPAPGVNHTAALPGFRAMRVKQLLQGKMNSTDNKFSVEDFEHMQKDVFSVIGCDFKSFAIRRLRSVQTSDKNKRDPESEKVCKAGGLLEEDGRWAMKQLKAWDCRLTTDSVAATVYQVWRQMALQEILQKASPDVVDTFFGKGLAHVWNTRMETANHDKTTLMRILDPSVGDSQFRKMAGGGLRILCASLAQTIRLLESNYGVDRSSWTWGRLHSLTMSHSLSAHPLLAHSFKFGPLPSPGDDDTVFQQFWKPQGVKEGVRLPWSTTSEAPSMRVVIDLADFRNSRWASPGGLSGWIGDGAGSFEKFVQGGESMRMLWDDLDIEEATRGNRKVVLVPLTIATDKMEEENATTTTETS